MAQGIPFAKWRSHDFSIRSIRIPAFPAPQPSFRQACLVSTCRSTSGQGFSAPVKVFPAASLWFVSSPFLTRVRRRPWSVRSRLRQNLTPMDVICAANLAEVNLTEHNWLLLRQQDHAQRLRRLADILDCLHKSVAQRRPNRHQTRHQTRASNVLASNVLKTCRVQNACSKRAIAQNMPSTLLTEVISAVTVRTLLCVVIGWNLRRIWRCLV